jgi:predicted nucleic acid-binding protein
MLEELLFVYKNKFYYDMDQDDVWKVFTTWVRLFRRSEPLEPINRVDLIKEDPDDNKYLECAMESDAQFIVTYNYKHFNQVKGKIFNKNGELVTICDGKEFLDILNEIKNGQEVSGA